jgi:hypothetical protein
LSPASLGRIRNKGGATHAIIRIFTPEAAISLIGIFPNCLDQAGVDQCRRKADGLNQTAEMDRVEADLGQVGIMDEEMVRLKAEWMIEAEAGTVVAETVVADE